MFMIIYFDKLFVRVYRQYIKWGEDDVPGVYALMVVSLFQAFNILAIIFLTIGISKGRAWNFDKLAVTGMTLVFLAFNYIRIYKLIGIKTFLEKYQDNLRLTFHPILYFVVSLGMLIVLRILGMFPHIT